MPAQAHVEVPVVENPGELAVETVDERPCISPDADGTGDGRSPHHEELRRVELPTMDPDDVTLTGRAGQDDLRVRVEDRVPRSIRQPIQQHGQMFREIGVIVIEDAEITAPCVPETLVDRFRLPDVLGQFDQPDGDPVSDPVDGLGDRRTAVIDHYDLELPVVQRLCDHAGQRSRYLRDPTGGPHEDREHRVRNHRLILITGERLVARPGPPARLLPGISSKLGPPLSLGAELWLKSGPPGVVPSSGTGSGDAACTMTNSWQNRPWPDETRSRTLRTSTTAGTAGSPRQTVRWPVQARSCACSVRRASGGSTATTAYPPRSPGTGTGCCSTR